jgi:hypothetical protein
MSSIQKFNTLIPRLIEEANNNTTINATTTKNWKLAATIVRGKLPISRVCANIDRGSCRGNICGSLHAEAHAIMDYYGKDLSYTPKHGWCFSQRKKGKSKG